jgi:diguanylate cyclase (GGDEF)-like protein/PAS domain S-box-containing protein
MNTDIPASATILVVDDTESVIDQLIGFLDGYDLVACTSGEEALSIVSSEQIDLVLLDVMMPGIDGLEVCRRLQASAGAACPPVIFITAHDDDATLRDAFAAGAADYVTKPVRKVELLARVGTQLARDRQHRQLREKNRELASARQALAESGERYRLAMEASRDGLWDWDLATPSVYYSPAWAQILGEDRVPTAYSAWDSRIHPDDRESVLGSLKQHLSAPGDGEAWTCEHRLHHADGSWVWVMGRGRVVQRDADGRPVRMVGTMVDISERKRNEQVVALRQQLAEMVYTSDINELMRTALDAAEDMTSSEIGFYHFVEEDRDTINLQVWSTRTLRDMCYAAEHEQHYPIAKAGVWADCIRQREVVVHNDYESLPHRKALPAGHAPVRRELTVPVMRENRVVAVMGVGNKHRPYNEEDKQVVLRIAGIAHDFVERKRVEQRIEFMAFNDTLTGLPNKELLRDRLVLAMAQARRAGCLLAVCYLDLDGFKPVNDQYGHHTGDALLVALAERLNGGLREGDTLARLGGDEFVILLTGLGGVLDSERILDRVLLDVGQPFDINGIEVSVTASIGVTLYPTDDVDADALLRHADQAMYKAKDAGRSVYMLYDPLQEQEMRSRLQLVNEFRQALGTGQLELYFQPRIDLRSGAVVGAEGLLRWNHPEHGQLLPGHFLRLVHGEALEFELDEWVLRQALKQHMSWREAGLLLPVSVNISPRQLTRLEFAGMLADVLAGYPDDVARCVELEVVESTSVADIQRASTTLRECARLGVKIALDDFGVGRASLMRFQDLPVDLLKIDQQLVHDILEDERDLAIIEGALRLAADLKNPVVAEGVETVEAGFMLLQLGCQYAQGFGIARPMPAEQMPDWIQGWSESNIWHRLNAFARQLRGPHDFGVSLFGHQHWLEQFESSVRAREADRSALLNETECSLDKWYHGIGQARYGDRTGFAFIPPRHLRVHEVGAAIVDSMRAGRYDSAIEQLGELKTCSEALISALRKLQAPLGFGN